MTATTAIVLVNTGSPEAPTEEALRVYLKEFLSDPRIIEMPRWLWLPILNLFILPSRPKKSAERYAKIWTETGSPLLNITRQTVDALRDRLSDREDVRIEMAMRVGQPSIDRVTQNLVAEGVERIYYMPLFAQYATQTTESILDAIKETMTKLGDRAPVWSSLPAYFDDPQYIKAIAEQTQAHRGESRHLVISFHGIPKKCTDRGDPYEAQCHATAQSLADALGLKDGEYSIAYQSRFGTDRWLQPYLPGHLRQLAKVGIRQIDIVCLSFAADCLETLEEIALEGREIFEAAGGEHFNYIPCINDSVRAIDLYETQIRLFLEK
jgi:ferrochelatase